ncbi:hypothetical protein QE152_g4088 [Popillia japonica]|uniref:Uncharacterized protein n=1 Tax=Popillia japonica TaxID=7064 RepID=A0AAW1N2I2_POPJA
MPVEVVHKHAIHCWTPLPMVSHKGGSWDQYYASYTPTVGNHFPPLPMVSHKGGSWDQYYASYTPTVGNHFPSSCEFGDDTDIYWS